MIDFNKITNPLPSIPIIDRRQFAQLCGLTVDTVDSMVERGYLPVIRLGGKRSFINLALLTKRCLDQEFSE